MSYGSRNWGVRCEVEPMCSGRNVQIKVGWGTTKKEFLTRVLSLLSKDRLRTTSGSSSLTISFVFWSFSTPVPKPLLVRLPRTHLFWTAMSVISTTSVTGTFGSELRSTVVTGSRRAVNPPVVLEDPSSLRVSSLSVVVLRPPKR